MSTIHQRLCNFSTII